MDISNLAKEFAKIVKPEEKSADVTLYGTTIISNGQLCVQLDGSDEITPAESTIEVAGGQRVAVLIKNHKAVITGSTTERAASSEDVDELYDQETIFNILTNNGEEQGLFLQNGKVYLNFSYAEGGTLKLGGASQNQYGILELVDTSDNDVILMDNTGLKLYDTDGTTVVGSMGPSGFTLKGGSQWDYDYSYSGVTGTCTFNYGLRSIGGGLSPGITLTNNRSDVQATGVFDICNDGYQTELHSTSEITLACNPGDGNVSYIDLYSNGHIQILGEKSTNNVQTTCCIDIQPMAGTNSEIVLYTPETHLNIDQYGVHTDQDFILDTAAKGLLGTVTGTNQPISMIAFSGTDNIVIGQTTNQSEYGNINLYAGTKSTNTINLTATKTTLSGTLTTGGTITTSGGLYTNGKTAVDDGVAGAAITTTGTIQLSASGTPYVYYRYGNSTSYYTRLAASNVTANRTLTLPNSTGTLAISSSDIRVKENVRDTTVKALDLIGKIKLHEFDWKEEGRGGSPHWKCGIIADELEELDDELTSGGGYNVDGSLNVKSIDTLYLEGYIVKALQELTGRIKKLEERK